MFSKDLTNLKILSVSEQIYEKYVKTTTGRSYYALSFRVYGQVKFICKEGCVTADGGQVVLTPPYKPYRLEHEREKLYVVYFLTDTMLSCEIHTIKPSNPSFLEEQFTYLYSLWSSAKTADRYKAYAVFYQILSELTETQENTAKTPQNEKLHAVENYIHDHFRDADLSVAHLSKIFGTSESYFRRMFTERYSVSPVKYIQNLKLKYALELLQLGEYSVVQIAEMSGFRDVKYFSRFIKNETGMSPGKFRKEVAVR